MIYNIVEKNSSDEILNIFSFSSVRSFDESWSATATSQVVEYGFNITDNVNIEAPVYQIDAVLSSYSLFDKNREIVWQEGTFKNDSSSNPPEDAHISARTTLIKMFEKRTVVNILETTANSNELNNTVKMEELESGYVRDIHNCVMTSLSISHPDNGTGSFLVSIKLQHIRVARVETTELSEEDRVRTLQPLFASQDKVVSELREESEASAQEVAAKESEKNRGKDSYGLQWEDGYNMTQRQAQPIKDEIEAQKILNEHMNTTGEYCELRRISGGYDRLCRSVK